MMYKAYITGLLVSVVNLFSVMAQMDDKFPAHLNSLMNEHSQSTALQQEPVVLYPDFQQLLNRQFQKKLKTYEIKSTGNQGKFQRDSVIGYSFTEGTDPEFSYKELYKYDIHGNMVLSVRYDWDTNYDAWADPGKEEFDYDARGKMIREASYIWNPVKDGWVNHRKSEHEYNDNGNLILSLDYLGDTENETWVKSGKTEFEYDANGNNTLTTAWSWNKTDEVWVSANKHEYAYDDRGNRILYIVHTRDTENQVWIQHIKQEYGYDSHGNVEFSAVYLWHAANELWIDQSHEETEYEYDANGKMTSSFRSIRDITSGEWGNFVKTEFEYDGGNLVFFLSLIRDAGDEEWVNHRKGDYDYDSSGNTTLDALYAWDPVKEAWINSRRFENTFDSSGNLIYASFSLFLAYLDDDLIFTYDMYYSRAFTAYFEDIDTSVGRIIEIPVRTGQLYAEDNITSFRFDFTFDSNRMEFIDYSLDGTLAVDGNIQVNPSDNNLLISWDGESPLSGDGKLINLRFRVIDEVVDTPAITGALFNDNTVNIGNGMIKASYKYGDIDANDHIQAFDAAIALQYSQGFDPIPEIAPLPWEPWRITTADVDGDGTVSENDALEILKYSVGLIDMFPSGENNGSVKSTGASVTVTYEDDYLNFTSSGKLYGLNVFIRENLEIPGEPVLLIEDILIAFNIDEANYAIGLAAAQPLDESQAFMKIPLTVTENTSITIDMFVNTEPVSITVPVTPTSAETIINEQVLIYPSPATNDLFVSGIKVNSIISVYDITGRHVLSVTATSPTEKIDVSPLQTGIYIIKISDRSSQKVSRFIKQ